MVTEAEGPAGRTAIIPGCEPFSADGGDVGVLLLHGFTGNPSTMVDLGRALAAEGHTVEVPRLPGHGTSVEEMIPTRWEDWSGAAEAAYAALAARTSRVVVVGLSMGGTLTMWLASRHPEVAGAVGINPLAVRNEAVVDFVRQALDAGTDRIPSIAGDVADPDQREKAYDATPLAPLLSLQEGLAELAPELAKVTCPVLILTSPQDHTVPPTDSDALAAAVAGPVERVTLARSYHVATIDYDRDLITERTIAFVRKVTAGT
ncbi:MAG TPA: alpha/beta fold hydrolase [Acidimicrobiales bacterium]|nr:alpha/beta fold hydrolase [Acidimicrobiales bacterium]